MRVKILTTILSVILSMDGFSPTPFPHPSPSKRRAGGFRGEELKLKLFTFIFGIYLLVILVSSVVMRGLRYPCDSRLNSIPPPCVLYNTRKQPFKLDLSHVLLQHQPV